MDVLSQPDVIRNLVVSMISLILSIAVHEFGHAFVADKLGDRLPRHQGRVTLNPLVHADPIGTYALPIGGFILTAMSGHYPGIGFGWGKPVQVNPAAFTRKLRMKVGHLLVSAAGPAMNLLFGTLVLFITFALAKFGVIKNIEIAIALERLIILNYILAFFNLVPVPPLDGGAVMVGLLPDRHSKLVDTIGQYSFMILAALMFTPARIIFVWPATKLYELIGGVVGLRTALASSLFGG